MHLLFSPFSSQSPVIGFRHWLKQKWIVAPIVSFMRAFDWYGVMYLLPLFDIISLPQKGFCLIECQIRSSEILPADAVTELENLDSRPPRRNIARGKDDIEPCSCIVALAKVSDRIEGGSDYRKSCADARRSAGSRIVNRIACRFQAVESPAFDFR